MSEDKARQRLGRGLASLIGGTGSGAGATAARGGFPLPAVGRSVSAEASERKVASAELRANPRNPRRTFAESDLSELTASVRQHGVVQPILVRRVAGQPGFEIVAGERRWRAALAAGLAQVPVVLREITDRESLEIAIVENVQRADLDAVEEALGYEMLMGEYGYTQADLGDVLGKSRSHVANTLRLLKLPDSVKAMVSRGELSAGAARTAVSQADPEAFARRIVDGGLSVREAEEMARVAALPEGEAPAARRRKAGAPLRSRGVAPSPEEADARALERLLADTLGLPVHIALAGDGGSLRLEFRDLDQLDAICRLLQARGRADDGPRIRTL